MRLNIKFINIILIITCIIAYPINLHATSLSQTIYQVEGIKGDALENVVSILQNKNQHETDLQKIRSALKPFGYFYPIILGKISYDPKKQQRIKFYLIQPGQQIKIRKLSIKIIGDGKNNVVINKFIRHFPIKNNQSFNTIDYNSAKDRLFAIITNQGYLNANFDNQLIIDPKKNSAYITINIKTGHKYYIGKITYGSLSYSKEFMDRVTTLNTGESFSSNKIRQLQQEMENSYYFSQVNIDAKLDEANDYTVPLTITTKTDKPVSYKVGVGYGATSGERVFGGISLRHLNDEGDHFEAQANVSEVLSGISANYYQPGKNPLNDTWIYSANYNLFLPNEGKSHVLKLSGGYESKTIKSQLTMNINSLIERFNVENFNWQTSHLLFPQLNYNYLNTDNLLSPRYALNINLTFSGASQTIASSTSYFQTDIKVKGLYAVGKIGRFILRGELGLTAIHNLPVFPLSMRFFAGGMGSIRGFADSSIGPGKYLEIGSLEYQHKIKGNLYAGVFYDIGRATNHFDTSYNRGIGTGLIYDTPIGPVKLYLAKAISKSSKPYSVEFSIGPEFS